MSRVVQNDEGVPPYELDMGEDRIDFEATTDSPAARSWAKRAYAQLLGCNGEEAYRLFQIALNADSNMAMAHVGSAFALISTFENEGGIDERLAEQQAHHASIIIEENPSKFPETEKRLVAAARTRCCNPKDPLALDSAKKSFVAELRRLFSEVGAYDNMVAAIFAEALMMLKPWMLWHSSGHPQIQETLEAKRILELILARAPGHPHACHLYIHLMEQSARPCAALGAADALRLAVPGQGHLVHLPARIYMRDGRYGEAVETNIVAIAADDLYVSLPAGQRLNVYSLFRYQHVLALVWAAMFDGRYIIALDAALKLQLEIDSESVNYKVDSNPVGAQKFEAFAAAHWQVRVRFGRWTEILREPLPDAELYPFTTAVAHCTKATAFAARGNVQAAKAEQKLFNAAADSDVLDGRTLNRISVRAILNVLACVLDGEIAYREARYAVAFDHLRAAVKLEHSLGYSFPASILVPPRHILGALLAEREFYEEAFTVFSADLEQYKENIWALRGLLLCANEMGKPAAEKNLIKSRLDAAYVRCDTNIAAASFSAARTVSHA